MIFIQQHVGFLIVLAWLVRMADIAITSAKASDYPRTVVYGIVALLLLFAALLALGFHE